MTIPANQATIAYLPDLDIRNVDALPRGTGAPYLLCIIGQAAGELIAKRWIRQRPDRVSQHERIVRF